MIQLNAGELICSAEGTDETPQDREEFFARTATGGTLGSNPSLTQTTPKEVKGARRTIQKRQSLIGLRSGVRKDALALYKVPPVVAETPDLRHARSTTGVFARGDNRINIGLVDLCARNALMGSISGRSVALSLPRRFICDLLHVSRHIPSITFERQVNINAVVTARKRLAQSPPWAVLLAKGFAIVAAHRPELRRTYLPFPWPHLWEAEESIAAVAIEREYRGEQGVFFGMLKAPNRKPLAELTAKVHEWKTKPLDEIAIFRRVLRYSRLPLLLRRFLWWSAVSCSGKVKARNFGTFGISLTGAAGATATNLIGPITTALNCGVIQPDGTMDLRLHFDHRVLDGMSAARALAELEEVLKKDIVAELEAMADDGAPRRSRNPIYLPLVRAGRLEKPDDVELRPRN